MTYLNRDKTTRKRIKKPYPLDSEENFSLPVTKDPNNDGPQYETRPTFQWLVPRGSLPDR